MNENRIKDLLMDIPTKLCRNMNQRFVNAILKDVKSDFSQHHFMILKLLNEGKKLYVTEIVNVLGITKPQMTASADKLLSLGYIKRIHKSKDRRKIYLSITDEGIDMTNKINSHMDVQINKNLVNLSKDELKSLEDGLEILFKFCSLYK